MGQQVPPAASPLRHVASYPLPGAVPPSIKTGIQDDATSPPYDHDADPHLRAVAIELSKMVAGDLVVIGDIPTAIAGLVPDWSTTTTFVTFDVRTHYQTRHPETQEQVVELGVLRTVLDPDMAMLDKKYPNSVNIFRSFDEESDIMVSLSISTSVDHQNRVKSARMHPKSRSKELFADQNRNVGEWKK